MAVDWSQRRSKATRVTELREAMKRELTDFLDAVARDFEEAAPDVERRSYAQQEAAARAYVEGTATPGQIQFLTWLAQERQSDIEIVVNKIITKADRFQMLVSRLISVRTITFDRIDALQSESYMRQAVNAAMQLVKENLPQ